MPKPWFSARRSASTISWDGLAICRSLRSTGGLERGLPVKRGRPAARFSARLGGYLDGAATMAARRKPCSPPGSSLLRLLPGDCPGGGPLSWPNCVRLQRRLQAHKSLSINQIALVFDLQYAFLHRNKQMSVKPWEVSDAFGRSLSL